MAGEIAMNGSGVVQHAFGARTESRKALWTGRILSGLVVAFMLVDGGMKVAGAQVVLEGAVALGYPASTMFGIGAVLLACTLLYAIPRTAVLGVVLLTGYLGGAIATHVRVGDPMLTHTLFPIYVAVLAWGGLYLRDARVRNFISSNR